MKEQTKPMHTPKHTKSVVRNLERGIASQAEIDALREINPRLAEIAEQQNKNARAAIAKAQGGSHD